jgi:hypothetical protein
MPRGTVASGLASSQLLGPPQSRLAAHGEDRGARPWYQGRGGGGRPNSRRGAARGCGPVVSRAWRRGSRSIWGEMGTGDSPDGLLHSGAHWSSRGTDVGCHPEDSRNRLAALRCSQRKMDSVCFRPVGAEAWGPLRSTAGHSRTVTGGVEKRARRRGSWQLDGRHGAQRSGGTGAKRGGIEAGCDGGGSREVVLVFSSRLSRG